MLKVSIIGFGRTGSHLFYALKATKKFDVRIAAFSHTDKIDRRILSDSKVILICTADKDITDTATQLRKNCRILNGKSVLHTSGAKNSDILNILRAGRAAVGSFHPVQTFAARARKNTHSFKDIFVAIEGDSRAVQAGFTLARAMGSRPFEISAENKVFHHICCVIASNYLVTLLAASERAFRKIRSKGIRKNGFNKTNFFDIYKPLIDRTLTNIRKSGAIASLTGPIERNDFETIKLHIKALKKSLPEILPVYTMMGIETVKAALKKKSLSETDALELLKLLIK
jgi:predicted short-subunit dehydrogenase-like oxidoreductase (DUF2520 family)